MKAEGIEYEERMELLDDVTYPKPLEELLDAAFEMYRRGHPWVADYQLSPKSVARDMYERAMTFASTSLLRAGPLRGTGAALPVRRLPGAAPDRPRGRQDRGPDDLIEWLGELVRQVDSSLLDEWEELVHPDSTDAAPSRRRRRRPRRRSRANRRAFRVLVRNALFRRVELAALRRRGAGRARRRRRLGRRPLGARRWTPYFDEHDDDRHRRRRSRRRRC